MVNAERIINAGWVPQRKSSFTCGRSIMQEYSAVIRVRGSSWPTLQFTPSTPKCSVGSALVRCSSTRNHTVNKVFAAFRADRMPETAKTRNWGLTSKSIVIKMTSVTGIVLVVDDEQPVLDYVARNLENNGYKVVTAASGEDALTLVKQQGIRLQLLVSDLVLPGMSGFGLADALRSENPNMKTLFMSGYTGAEYFRQMKVSMADIPFLQKPFTVDALLRKVQELLKSVSPKQDRTNQN